MPAKKFAKRPFAGNQMDIAAADTHVRLYD